MNNNITKGTWTAGTPSISKALSDKWECHIWSELNGNRVMVATVYGESKEQIMANAEFITDAYNGMPAPIVVDYDAIEIVDGKLTVFHNLKSFGHEKQDSP